MKNVHPIYNIKVCDFCQFLFYHVQEVNKKLAVFPMQKEWFTWLIVAIYK